jgi:hypothetical protein
MSYCSRNSLLIDTLLLVSLSLMRLTNLNFPVDVLQIIMNGELRLCIFRVLPRCGMRGSKKLTQSGKAQTVTYGTTVMYP